MRYLILLVFSLLTTNALCEELSDKEKPKLQFAFITVRVPSYTPYDYPAGPQIIGRPESSSRLTWRGRYDAYDYGREINERYGPLFNIDHWNKSLYWSLASTSPRSKQGALILKAGMENKRYKVHGKWSDSSKNFTQFPAMLQYLKFYSEAHCPGFFKAFMKNRKPFTRNHHAFEKAMRYLQKHFIKKDVYYAENPQDIWLTYETLNNVFYSFKKRYPGKYRKWKKIRNVLREFSENVIWHAVTGKTKLRKMASGLILKDILNDIDGIKNGTGQPKAPGGVNNKLSILTAPQGILAALVAAFAPRGTQIDGKPFTAKDLYPEFGAMHIIELYKANKDKWKIKVLYRNKKRDRLRVMRLGKCGNKKLCDLDIIKRVIGNFDEKEHSKLCQLRPEKY